MRTQYAGKAVLAVLIEPVATRAAETGQWSRRMEPASRAVSVPDISQPLCVRAAIPTVPDRPRPMRQ
jgi:hypothetical protein